MKHLGLVSLCFLMSLTISFAQPKSFTTAAKSFSDFISMKYEEQIAESLSAAKNEKQRVKILQDHTSVSSTLEKITALDAIRLDALNSFVSSMSVQASMPTADSGIVVYLNPTPIKHNYLLYLFVDGDCLAAGTVSKGLSCLHPLDVFKEGFHSMLILACSEEKPEKMLEVFSSTVHFGLKSTFLFDYKKKGKSFELSLKN